MAESRIKLLTIGAWTALLLSAGALVAVGIVGADGAALSWILEVILWSVVITGVALVTVPAPSGSRLSLGIGAAVAASVLLDDPVALGASISIALVVSWLIQTRFDVGPQRSDGDYLADSLAMVLYAVVYSYAYEIITTHFDLQPTWAVLSAVAVAGFAWFSFRAVVAAFVGLLEVAVMRDITGGEFVGDFRNGALDFGWDTFDAETQMTKRAVELNQGRAAMMGLLGLMVHDKLGNLESILPL